MKRPKDTFGFCRTGAAIHTAVDWRSRRAGLLGTKAVRRCFAGVFHNVCRVMRWWTERCTKRGFLAHTRTIPCPPTGTVHWARYAQLTDDPWILATVCVCVCVCVCGVVGCGLGLVGFCHRPGCVFAHPHAADDRIHSGFVDSQTYRRHRPFTKQDKCMHSTEVQNWHKAEGLF